MVTSFTTQEGDQHGPGSTMNKSGLQGEAEKLSQDLQAPSTVLVWIYGAWEWRFSVVQAAICWCWSTEESRDRDVESEPMGRWIIAGSRTARLTRTLRRAEWQSTRLR